MSVEYYRILIIISLFATSCAAACIKSEDLPQLTQYNSSYCLPVIKWNISQDIVDRYAIYDGIAQARYTKLYSSYYNNNRIVDIDCLGMAKYFFCASAYPVCTDTGTQQKDAKVICNWLCQLYNVRCSQAPELITDICSTNNKSDSLCSWQSGSLIVISISILVLIIVS